jgi:hypothetical protein
VLATASADEINANALVAGRNSEIAAPPLFDRNRCSVDALPGGPKDAAQHVTVVMRFFAAAMAL